VERETVVATAGRLGAVMDDRRRKWLLAASALIAAPLATHAQAPKLPVVAYLFGGRVDAVTGLAPSTLQP
jgi:hypothetical protein